MATVVISAPVSNRPTYVSAMAGRSLFWKIKEEYPDVGLWWLPAKNSTKEHVSVLQKLSAKDTTLFVYMGHGKVDKVCLTPDAEITTKNGIKRIDQIREGESVLTHKGRFRTVNRVYKRKYIGDMVEITPFITDVPLKLTPDHPVLAMDCDRCHKYPSRFCYPTCTYLGKNCKSPIYSEPKWIDAKDVEVRDVVMFPRYDMSVNKKRFKISKTVNIDLTGQKQYEKIMKLRSEGMGNWRIADALNLSYKTSADIYIYKGSKPHTMLEDGLIMMRNGNGVRCMFDDVVVDSDFMKLAGFYVSEGHTASGRVVFSFGAHETEYIAEVQDLIKTKFNLSPTTRTGNGETQLQIGSVYLSQFFTALFGTGTKNKMIPDWIMYAKDGLRKVFIEYLYRGDGQTKFDNRTRVRYASTSKQLIDDLRTMLLNFGIVCGPSFCEYITPTGKTSGCYYLEVSSRHYTLFDSLFNIPIPVNPRRRGMGWSDDNYVYIPVKHKKITHYDGLVYNLEVDADNSYVANFITVHNCGKIPPGCGGSGEGMIDPDNVDVLSNMITFAVACWTSCGLGRLAEETGALNYVGFRKSVFVAFDLDEHDYSSDIIDVWHTFPLRLLAGDSSAKAIAEMSKKSIGYEKYYTRHKDDLLYGEYYSRRFKSNRLSLLPFGNQRARLI